jgi:hypothetical protein
MTLIGNIEYKLKSVKTTFVKHLQQGKSCTSLSSFKHLQENPKTLTQIEMKPPELISCNMITKLLQNIFDCDDLSICGNASMVKAQKTSNFHAQFLFQDKHT